MLYMTRVIIILFIKKMEPIKYNAAMVITSAIRGSSKERIRFGVLRITWIENYAIFLN